MSQILVVSSDGYGLTETLGVLNGAGYEAIGASTFQDATRLLASKPPDLVIADERLGEFNGLHVILKARDQHPEVAAIVTAGTRSRGLEADAKTLKVQCMVASHDPLELLSTISRTLEASAVRARRVS